MSPEITRRQFVLGAAGVVLLAGCGRLPWQAQPPAKVARIGVLFPPAAPAGRALADEALVQGLREFNWVEGQNLIIEWRWAGGSTERLAEMAAELADLPVDVIVAGGEPAIFAARKAAGSIPIVMGNSSNPVEAGLIASLGRPGGNITGLTQLGLPLSGKRLELLQALFPGRSRVAILGDGGEVQIRETERAAQTLGVQLYRLPVHEPDDLDDALASAAHQGVEGLIVLGGPFTLSHQERIVELAAARRLPAMYDRRGFVNIGGLMSYAPKFIEMYHRAAYYVDRILKGTKPADLPVEQPMRFDFVVNMKTARELGIIFPREILLQVTEVIE
jgi:putative ABC transport system substrate-binding protein